MSISPPRFAGYAALFDLRDAGRDVIRKGAFTKSLARRTAALPLLWQHRPDHLIGTIEHIREDQRGLRIIARVEQPRSRGAHLLASGKVTGLSFGYVARSATHSCEGRELFEIDLFEISVVTHPLQHGARIHLIA